MKKSKIFLFSVFLISLLLFLIPASRAQAEPAIAHPMDQALLLMFSSHMRLNGEVESAVIPTDQVSTAHLAAFSPQTQTDLDNEINAVIDLYVTMIANLQASGNYNRQVEDQLVAQMNEKVDALQAKAQALEARRSRRRGGFFRGIVRVLNRVVKAVGRGTGWVVGKAMDGAGEVATFAIEEVSPQVLKAHLLGGAPLNTKLFRLVARDLLKKRVRTAAENYVLRLAERIARRQAAQGEALATEDPQMMETYEAEFGLDAMLMEPEEMDATLEARKTPQSTQVPDNGSGEDSGSGDSSGGSSSGSDIVTYTFTESDAFNFGSSQFYTGGIGWDKWSGRMENDDWCFFGGIESFSAGTVYLEFDRQAMTVSGRIEGNGRDQETFSNSNMNMHNLSGSYQMEFSNIPASLPTEFEIETALKFVGTANVTVTTGGTFACRYRDTDTNQDMYRQVTDQTSVGMQVPLKIVLYKPGITLGNHPATLGVHTDVHEENNVSIGVIFLFDQPIDVPLP